MYDPDREKKFEYQYQKPDITKKYICKEDTPLHGAKDGKYNLNWFDD